MFAGGARENLLEIRGNQDNENVKRRITKGWTEAVIIKRYSRADRRHSVILFRYLAFMKTSSPVEKLVCLAFGGVVVFAVATELRKEKDSFSSKHSEDVSVNRFFSDSETITDIQAKEFGEINNWELDYLKGITDLQAELLIKCRSRCLKLGGLSYITDAQARSFGSLEAIQLNGLTAISDIQAEYLSQCGNIQLDALTSISDVQAESFSKCHTLMLGGLTEISDSVAKSFGECNELYLDGLTKISDAQAKSLGKCQILYLNGLEEITDTQAKALGNCPYICVDGLTSISDAQAKAFQKCDSISLNGLASINDVQAEALGKCERLCLMGLTKLSDAQAKSICMIPYLELTRETPEYALVVKHLEASFNK